MLGRGDHIAPSQREEGDGQRRDHLRGEQQRQELVVVTVQEHHEVEQRLGVAEQPGRGSGSAGDSVTQLMGCGFRIWQRHVKCLGINRITLQEAWIIYHIYHCNKLRNNSLNKGLAMTSQRKPQGVSHKSISHT